MFDFEKLEVYKKSKNFNKRILKFIKNNPSIDSYLKNQLKRASISIVINIAEGSGRFTKADKRNFYIIARGSVYECVSLLDIIFDEFVSDEQLYDDFYGSYEELSKMLLGLINSQT